MYVFQTPPSGSEPFVRSERNKEIDMQFDGRDKQERQDVDESSRGMATCLKLITNTTFLFYHILQTCCGGVWCGVPPEHCRLSWTVTPWGCECIPSSCLNTADVALFRAFQAVTKDRESVLRKQQEDIGYLSRHLDHVISFTKWATARNRGTGLLYCKRLVRLVWSFISSHEQLSSESLAARSWTWWSGSICLLVIHKCFTLKIIDNSPSAADSVSDWKPPAGKMQYLACTTEHRTLPVSILLLGLKCWSGYDNYVFYRS